MLLRCEIFTLQFRNNWICESIQPLPQPSKRGFCSRCSSKLFHTQGLLSSLLSFLLWICIRIQSSCQLGVPRPYVRYYTFYYTPNFLLSSFQRELLFFSRSNVELNNGITSRSFCEQSDYIYVELSLFLQLH